MRTMFSHSLLFFVGVTMVNSVIAFQPIYVTRIGIRSVRTQSQNYKSYKDVRGLGNFQHKMIGNVRPIQMTSDIDSASPLENKKSKSKEISIDGINGIKKDTSVQGNQQKEHQESDVPGVQRILRFAIPAVGVWLCSPLLSLIDTSAVGILSGTVQQAALAPAVSITDYGALLMAFLYTGTTNLVAAAQEKDGNDENHEKTQSTLVGALQLASYVGVGFSVLFGLSAKLLIQTIISNDAVDPVVFRTAVRYCRIRSLGLPAAAVIGSAQAACLGMQDMKSPLYVLLAAAVVNLFGDMILVRNPNMWIGGAAGAAWATVLSQYTALAMFMAWLKFKPRQRASTSDSRRTETNGDDSTMESASAIADDSKPRKKKPGPPVTRGILSGKFRGRDLVRFPTRDTIEKFSPYVVPVSSMSIGRISGYLAMSHVAASTLGTLEMAAQQILFSFFCCFIPICEALNLTAQSFVPRIFERKPSPTRTDELKRTIINFIKAGGIAGGALVAIMACIPLFSPCFSLDPEVITKVNSATPIFAFLFSLFGIVNSGEGKNGIWHNTKLALSCLL